MRVNIIYEVNNREFNNCLLLQRELIRRGHDARIYNKTEDILLEDNSGSITFIPNSYRNEDLAHYRYCFNTNGGIVILYPCEQVTNHTLPTFFDYSDKNEVKKLPVLCWGQDYYDFITRLGFNNQENRVVGALQLDFFRNQFRQLNKTRLELSDIYGLPLDKKWCLFVSDFVFNSNVVANQIKTSGDIDEKIVDNRHNFGIRSCEKILEWFAKLMTDHPDIVIIYRKHPVEQLTQSVLDFAEEYKSQFYTISDFNIREWISNCDIISSWYSTSVVECVAAKRGMILLRPYEMDENSGFTDYEFYKGYGSVSSYEQFEDSIMNYDNSYQEKTLQVIDDLYSIEEKPTYMRVVDAIEDIYSHWDEAQIHKERNFYYKRWTYLIKNLIPVKLYIKKIIQKIYIRFNFHNAFQGESRVAIGEWIASAKNRKVIEELQSKIDNVISSQ